MERYNYSLEPRLNARLLHLRAALTNKTMKTGQSSIADFAPGCYKPPRQHEVVCVPWNDHGFLSLAPIM